MNNPIKFKRKEICFISTVHQLYDTRIYFKEIKSLVNSGYIVNYILKEDKILFDHPNINFLFLPNKPGLWNRVKNIFRAIRLGNNINNQVYHIHDPELIIAGLYFKIFKRKSVIYDIHELYFDELKYKPYLNKSLSQIVSFFYRIIDYVSTKLFDNNILAEDKYQDYYKGDNFILVQNYILSKYIVDKPYFRSEDQDKLHLVYVGSIRDVRGVFEMLNFIDLITKEQKICFHLIGSFTPRELRDDIYDLISKKQLNDKIKIYGVLPFPEAQKIVRKCDIGLLFLHPIVNNLTILATKMFEYMGNGLAVLMSNFPLWIEFNKKYNCGLTLDIFNLENEKLRIQKFLRDKERIDQIRFANIQTVRENFVWEYEEKKLLNLYKQIVN